MLQWGQRLSVLDTRGQSLTSKRAEVASMGPTSFSVGYLAESDKRCRACNWLQWGQRLSALDTAFSPRFSLIIPLFGGECRHFARGSFFWMRNRDGFRPSEPLLDRFFANAPSWAVRRRSVRSAVLTMSWVSRAWGGGAYSDVKEGRAPRYAARGSARFSSGQRGISDSWTPRTSSASRQKLLKASSLTG